MRCTKTSRETMSSPSRHDENPLIGTLYSVFVYTGGEIMAKSQKHRKKKMSSLLSEQDGNKGYRVIGKSTSIWKPYTRLYSIHEHNCCPQCRQTLRKDETIIPIGDDLNLLVEGGVCPKCRSMFVQNADDIFKILKDNPFSEGFYINDAACWQYSELKRKKIQHQRMRSVFDSMESAVVLISVTFQDKRTDEYIISTDKNADSTENVVCYLSPIGRELLTAAYVNSRGKTGSIDGRKYSVTSMLPKDGMPETLIPSSVTVKTDGGYISSVKNRNFEIVDLLLYSPCNDIYECVHATYNKLDNVCFMDISIYRRFLHKHGNPGLKLHFPEGASGKYGELEAESILRGYGYSVGRKENLSSSERRAILSELVDLEILTVARIVRYLDFFIRRHKGLQYAEAVSKWTSDKEFIKNYKVNPARFMLSKRPYAVR